MIDVLADIGFAVYLAIGVFVIVGFLAFASWTDVRNNRHPGGRAGRLTDEAWVIAPLLPWLLLVLTGAAYPALREQDGWFMALVVLALGGLAVTFSPPARRAKARLDVLRGSPPQ